ncbi:MAG TPA: hypothetical protein DD414_08875 [Lachnospiraceae bacterium]|nr:hypothetical protein [Lachnospiraceae bacterium]
MLNKRAFVSRFDLRVEDLPPIIDLTEDVLHLMLDNYYDGMPPERGLFIIQTDNPVKFKAVDNSTGGMLIKEFDDRFAAERWLREEGENG